MEPSRPRALSDRALVAHRREQWMSDEPLATLRDFMADLGTRGREAPVLDPSDAGTRARVLFVLEAPGPRAAAESGSGFISADNNDQTAANVWQARSEVGLIDGVLQTNIVPWYLGAATVKPTALQLADGALQLRYLLDLLPDLQTVVLCGDFARRGWRRHVAELIDGPGPVIIETHHPSPLSLNRGTRRAEFTAAIARAAAMEGMTGIEPA